MQPSPVIGDALGEALLDALSGGEGRHFVERDDGLLETMDASRYFSEPRSWPNSELRAMESLEGRVLDIGAGAGRHSLMLQNHGCEPMALDSSPGAIDVCRRRGVEWTFKGTVQDLLEFPVEPFDAITLMGNNLALLQSEAKATGLFRAMASVLKPGGVVVGTCLDPHRTDNPDHLSYHEANRSAGRPAGQIRMRFRYQRITSPWLRILLLSPDELCKLAARNGWEVLDVTRPSPNYLAALRPL